MRDNEGNVRILKDYGRKTRTVPRTRPLGGLGFAQQAQACQAQGAQLGGDAAVPADANNRKETANENPQSTNAPDDAAVRVCADAHDREGTANDDTQGAQPRVAAAVRRDDDAKAGSFGIRRCFSITVGIVLAVVIMIAGVLTLTSAPMVWDPESHNPLGTSDGIDNSLVLRLNEAIDIRALRCVVGRLLPLPDSPTSAVAQNPEQTLELFLMLEQLSALENVLVSELNRLHTRAAALERRRVEISVAPHNQSPGFVARAKAIRDSQALVTQVSLVQRDIARLVRDINKQTESLIPRITGKAEGICFGVRGSPLANVFRTQVWVDPKKARSPETNQVLVHWGFCSTIQSLHSSRSNRTTPNTPRSAAREADGISKQLDHLMPKAMEALKEFESGCDFLCSVVWYLNEVRWGPAAASPSH